MVVRARTSDWPRSERVERWREEFGRQVVPLEVLAHPHAPDLFDLDLAMLPGASLRLVQVAMHFACKYRDRDRIRDDDDSMSLITCRSGVLRIETGERRAELSPGRWMVLSNMVPVRIEAHAARVESIQLPRAALGKGGDVSARAGELLSADRFEMRLLNAYTAELWHADAIGSMAERHVGELVLAVLDGSDLPRDASPASRATSRARLIAARQIMRAHAHDFRLSLDAVAALLGVSARSVQRSFADQDSSFREELLNHRLDCAHERLMAAGLPERPRITEVAYQVGFADLSYFNRTYRQRYGCTPTETRRALL